MQKTVAEVKYRHCVPRNCADLRFCKVQFSGFYSDEMDILWKSIQSKRYQEYAALFEENKSTIRTLRSKARVIRKQIKKANRFWWYNNSEKQMLREAKDMLNQASELEKANEVIKEKKEFSSYEAHERIKELLQAYGFVLTQTSCSEEESSIYTEIWTYEE